MIERLLCPEKMSVKGGLAGCDALEHCYELHVRSSATVELA
jgi:hypothetical protein